MADVPYSQTRPSGPADLWSATLEVFDAGQQVVADRAALVRATVVQDITRVTVAVALAAPSAVLGLLGSIGIFAALALWLNRYMPVEAAIGIVSVAALIGCGIAAAIAYRQVQLLWKEEESDV